MKKADLRGLAQVFGFTLRQHYKSRATKITLVMLVIMALIMPPLMSVIMGDNARQKAKTPVTIVYIDNQTDCAPVLTDIAQAQSAEDAQASARITRETDAYHIAVSGGEEYDLAALQAALQEALYRARMQKAGVSQQQLSLLSASYSAQSGTVEEYLHPQQQKDTESAFAVTYVFSILTMTLCMMSSSYVIRAVVEEKDSKLVEQLMVSVSPLAMMLGKILAVMCFMFAGLLGVAGCAALSVAVSGQFLDMSYLSGMLGGLGLSSLSAGTLLSLLPVALVTLILGFAVFALLAGVLGAGCSSIDDMQSASFTVLVVVMTGYLGSVVSSAVQSGAATMVCSLLPVLSAFCAPANYALGLIGFGTLAASWALQALLAFVLALLCARVYRRLILYQGARVGLSKMIAMAKRGERA